MTSLNEQLAYIRLEPLTPIHIGTGNSMDPLGYVMREEAGQPFLYPVDMQAWVEAQPNPAELAQMFAEKTLPQIRAHLAREIVPNVDSYGGAPARIVWQEIYDVYKAELNRSDSPNQLIIEPALKNPLIGALLVPGSSIKGAIRTAVIDWLDEKRKEPLKNAMRRDWGRGYNNALEEMLGKIGVNAFRNLKVGDFPAALGESLIMSAAEVRLKDKPSTPKNPCETTLSHIMGHTGYAIYGKIVIGAHGGGGRDAALTVAPDHNKSKAWTLAELMELCNDFYIKRYRAEYHKFYGLSHLANTKEALEAIEPAFDNPGKGSMLLRLGHYSHVECMTVSNNEPQTRPLKDGSQLPFGTTRTLANGIYPFGWARLSLISAEEYQQACRQREQRDAMFVAERAARYQEIARRHEIETQQKLEREQAAQERKEAEAQRQAALAAMSPEERLISIVADGNCVENTAVELYSKLDELDSSLCKAAAQALKSFWQKNDKWEKKKCTAKQWAKVSKLREILED